jgi:hypothetical protein
MGGTVVSDDERQMQIWHVQDMAYDSGRDLPQNPWSIVGQREITLPTC